MWRPSKTEKGYGCVVRVCVCVHTRTQIHTEWTIRTTFLLLVYGLKAQSFLLFSPSLLFFGVDLIRKITKWLCFILTWIPTHKEHRWGSLIFGKSVKHQGWIHCESDASYGLTPTQIQYITESLYVCLCPSVRVQMKREAFALLKLCNKRLYCTAFSESGSHSVICILAAKKNKDSSTGKSRNA